MEERVIKSESYRIAKETRQNGGNGGKVTTIAHGKLSVEMWRRFLMKMPCLFEDQMIVQISPFLLSAIIVQIGDDNVSISLSFEMVLIQAEQTT